MTFIWIIMALIIGYLVGWVVDKHNLTSGRKEKLRTLALKYLNELDEDDEGWADDDELIIQTLVDYHIEASKL